MQDDTQQLNAVVRLLALTLLIAVPKAALAQGDPAVACVQAAVLVSEETSIPLDVLRAIARTETGRGPALQPWPWTVNMEGKGIWFDTEDQAQLYVFRHFKSGVRSFDIGCFQINYRWHGHAFASIEDMFEPVLNARYAGTYLRELQTIHGDWDKAVGAYHSRTHQFALRYLNRFTQIHDMLDPIATTTLRNAVPQPPIGKPHQNKGSLVPLTVTRADGVFHPGIGG